MIKAVFVLSMYSIVVLIDGYAGGFGVVSIVDSQLSYRCMQAAHFDALSLTPEVYLMQWLVSLFSTCLPPSAACRTWDCFFLFGEVYAFQASVFDSLSDYFVTGCFFIF